MRNTKSAAKVLKITTILLFVVLANEIKAQNKLRLGLFVSPNFGWFSEDEANLESDGSVLKFAYGLTTEIRLGQNENYALLTGIGVFNTAGAFKDDLDNRYKQNIQYLEIPTAIKLKSNEVGYFTYFGKFGISNKFKLAADVTNSFPGMEDIEIGNAKDIYLYNASLLVGIGAEYNLSGNTSFLFGIDFHNGFVNVYDNKSNVGKVKPYNLSINVGVLF